MTDANSTVGGSRSPGARGFEPDVPITVSPILDWPPRPAATLRHIASMMLPQGLLWGGHRRGGVELLHTVDGAHGDPEPEMGAGDLCPQRRDVHPGGGNAACGAVRPAGPAAALQVRAPVAEHHQPRVPVEQPDPRQHVLVPGQRLLGVDRLRGADHVVLRQRLDPAGGSGPPRGCTCRSSPCSRRCGR